MKIEGFPTVYRHISEGNPSEDCTIFLGLVILGVLDVRILKEKAPELVAKWPVLSGQTSPYSFTTGTTIDFESRHIPSQLNDILTIDISPSPTATREASYRSYKHNSASNDDLFHFNSAFTSLPSNIFIIRVTTLNNATLLGFQTPHALCDAQALYEVVKSYRDRVSGLDIPKIVLCPAVEVLLSTLIEVPPDHQSESAFFNAPLVFNPFTVLSKQQVDVRWYDEQFELASRERGKELYVHLSADLVEGWLDDCQREIVEAASLGMLEEAGGIKLTKNDVLTAWFLKENYANSESKEIDLNYSFNYRSILPPPSTRTTYLHNSYYDMLISFLDIQNMPLSRISLVIRLAVLQNTQLSVSRNVLRFWEDAKGGVTLGPRGCKIRDLVYATSWTRFNLIGMDWSSALAGAGEGKVVWASPSVPMGEHASINYKPFPITLKDGAGGYWVRAWTFEDGHKENQNR